MTDEQCQCGTTSVPHTRREDRVSILIREARGNSHHARSARSTRDLCGDCWLDVHPTEYAPLATRYGTCARCGYEALVVRSHIEDEEADR